MTRLGRRVVTLTSALALAVAPVGIPASSATTQAPVSAYLAAHLEAGTADLLPVFVHADDVATAKRAVSASGLVLVTRGTGSAWPSPAARRPRWRTCVPGPG